MVAGISATCRVLAATAAVLVLVSGEARASEEAVDRATQMALSLDAHPDRGAAQFHQYCARCHGAQAQGDPIHAIPALAGQRFAYLVRQLANFSGFERDSNTMHGVLLRIEPQGAQTWVDIAAFLNRAPLGPHAQTGDGTQVALGRGIFHEQCASCHRGDAHGDANGFVPSLRNQRSDRTSRPRCAGCVKQRRCGKRMMGSCRSRRKSCAFLYKDSPFLDRREWP